MWVGPSASMALLETPDHQHSPNSQPLVWIVVLHFLGIENTALCLSSLKSLSGVNYRVLLVNNGSPDEGADNLAAQFSSFDYLKLTDNLGFAGGCNAGADHCLRAGADWIWFLNNDARVEPDTLAKLMAAVANNSQISAAGPLVLDDDGKLSSGLGTINFLSARAKSTHQPSVDITSCQWISGCALLVRAAAFAAVQGFDENYFLYFEDTDLCLRLANAGGNCVIVRDAIVHHTGNVSTAGKYETWRSYYYTRNRMYFFTRHCKQLPGKALAMGSIAFHLLRHSITLPLKGVAARRQLRAELLGGLDFVKQKFGKATCLNW